MPDAPPPITLGVLSWHLIYSGMSVLENRQVGGIYMTARQKVYKYFSLNKEYPSKEVWAEWGYNRTYYYEVKKKWDAGEDFNEPENKKDRMLFRALKESCMNKDGVICVSKTKDLSSLSDWITFIREDDSFKYYIINW